MAFEIVEYTGGREIGPFRAWFDGLDHQAALKVQVAIRRMEVGNLGDWKHVGDGVMERRINWGPGLRIYFARDGDRIVLLLRGGTKRRQQKDIDLARAYWAEYRSLKGEP